MRSAVRIGPGHAGHLRGCRNRHPSPRRLQLRVVATDVLRIPIADAARRLGCSVKTLKRRAAAGRIQLVKDGSRLYVPEASLRAYAGEEQAAAEQAAGWQELTDLRLLFPIPELEDRRAAREAAKSGTNSNKEKKR